MSVKRAEDWTQDEIWARVLEFAKNCKDRGIPVPTLQKQVLNFIREVHPGRIERDSEQGRTNKTPIRRGAVLEVWELLLDHGYIDKPPRLYFTPALLQAAIPELIDNLGDGRIALASRRSSRRDLELEEGPPQGPSYAELAARFEALGASASQERQHHTPPRESDTHWAIKHFIHAQPNHALSGLPGQAWTPCALERPLPTPTRDCVDVLTRELGKGQFMIIEVKPRVASLQHARGLYAQAAKYRAIWRVLYPDAGEVRCALAAPSIPRNVARYMLERHHIESVEVTVPSDFEVPQRPTTQRERGPSDPSSSLE